MPNAESHRNKAIENRKVLNLLCIASEFHGDWVCSVVFYTALHLVDSLLSYDKVHPNGHGLRKDELEERYGGGKESLSHLYQKLRGISEIARYMTGGHVKFDDYMSPNNVKKLVIEYILPKIETIVDAEIAKRQAS